MATPSNTDTSIVKEEICDDEDIETHQRVYMLPNPNPNQTNHSTITTIATSSSLKVPSRCSHSDEDDLDTFSAIKKRFSMYASGNLVSLSDKPYSETLDKIFTVLQQAYGISQPLESFESSALPHISSDFLKPELIKTFIHSIMKNHSYQRCISTKLKEIGARLEEAKRLKGYIRILKDFQFTCKTRTGQCSSLKRDANVQLISYRKSMTTHYSKVNNKKLHAMFYGPLENTHVANYKMVLMKYPVSLHKQKWSKIDEDSLREGIEQQFQEMLLQKAVEHYSGSDESCGDLNDFEKAVASIKDVESTPENLRLFLPKVDWQRLACMYVSGRSGAECEARWLNIEDPLVNKNLWTNTEEKKLLIIIQKRGLYNWIEIAKILNTNRTPFQCLARYQQSLNSHIMKQEWTAEDDAQLCEAVEACGEHDWQQVAFKLERRTGTQCSNRWHKTLNPKRERVGRWTVEEDQHLKVAVMLFGPKTWNKIAQFVSGRTQVQCRERWMNVLDPSLNLQKWTEEEDSKLKAAIAEHGHCWSKVAASVAPRTDNQCRRRWKVLLPHEAPLLQASRKIQKSSFISNFVDRREERPALCPSDFLSLPGADAVPEAEKRSSSRKKNKTSRENRESKKQRDKEAFNIVPCEVISERSPSEPPASSKNVSRMENDDIPEPFVWDETILKLEKTLKLQSRNRCTEPVHVLSQELTTSPQPLNLTANGDDVQTLVNEGFPRMNNVEEIWSCNGDSSTSPKWEASKSQPQNCECREPAPEHQVLSLPQIETMSPRKIKQVLPNSLMIVPNSYNGLKSECGEGQNQPNDLNGASSLVHEAEPCCSISGTPKISSSHNTQLNHHPANIQATVMENQECVHGDGTLMEMEGIKLETQCDIGDCSSLSVSQSFRSSDWHSLSHQTNGTSDVALSMERMINAAGLSLNNSLDYFPCPESIIEEPSNSLEQDGV